MEREGPHRRQHERSSFPSIPVPPARRVHPDITTNIQSASRSQDLEDVDRYRQSRYIASQPPASTAIPVNTNTQDITSFGPFSTTQSYSSTQMHGHRVPYQYQPEYTQDPQRQQIFQHQYTPQVIYNTQQGPQQTPYEPVVQYQTRQSVPSDVLPNQFGDSQFFNSNAAGSTSASTGVPTQFPTASYQQPVQYTPQAEVGRPSIVPQYPDTQSEFIQPPTPTVVDPNQQQADRYDVLFNQYRRALRETNDNASRGRLIQAGESLLEISQWLLGNAEGLELTKDNQAIHPERLKLWKDFNYCWLAFLTRQLDDTQRIQATGRGALPGQSVLSTAALQNLGDELTRLCDGLEKSGLVDYEMGVWEEEIILLLLQCKELNGTGNKDPAQLACHTDQFPILEIDKDTSSVECHRFSWLSSQDADIRPQRIRRKHTIDAMFSDLHNIVYRIDSSQPPKFSSHIRKSRKCIFLHNRHATEISSHASRLYLIHSETPPLQ